MNTFEKSNIMLGLSAILYESPSARSQRQQKMTQQRTGFEPWHRVQLSKAERKGKTPEELRLLRIQKWKQQHQEPEPS